MTFHPAGLSYDPHGIGWKDSLPLYSRFMCVVLARNAVVRSIHVAMILYIGILNAWHHVRGKIASGVAVRDDGGVAGEEKVNCIDSDWTSNASSGLCIIIGHSNLIFGFWSYPSFLHNAGGWVIKTIGLCYPFMKSQPLHILCSRSRFCNVSESLLAARWDCSSSHGGCWKVFQRSANAWELHPTFQNYTLCSPHKLNQKLKINLEWPSITQVLYFASWDVMLV